MNNNNTFINKKITNEDIYNKLVEHEKILEGIGKRQDITNGKVKLGRWISTTALMISLMILGFLLQHINK
jgi:hypothetical protein